MPRRKPAYRRVTPLASRRETQRRAAVAALALITVVGGLGLAVYAVGGTGQRQAISSVNAGQAALEVAQANLEEVSGPGIDLTETDPEEATELLIEAYASLDAAEAADVSPAVVRRLRAQVVGHLDELWGVVPVRSRPIFTFTPEEGAAAFDLRSMVRGPDGAPYVIDGTTKTVYRVDLERERATAVLREGREAKGKTIAEPLFLAVGGRDLLILDAKNVLWRWRAADDAGDGTLTLVTVNGASKWGDDITAIGTHMRDVDRNLYNLYVIDPSEEQIRAYPPASDGSGFPADPSGWLATARDVDRMSSMYIDGDIYITEGGLLERFTGGRSDGWEVAELPDGMLREGVDADLVAGAGQRGEGTVYVFDRRHDRVIAFRKGGGQYVAQYRLAGSQPDWEDLRSMYVLPGIEEEPSTLIWLGKDGLHEAPLVAVDDRARPSATPTAAPSEGEGEGEGEPTATPGD